MDLDDLLGGNAPAGDPLDGVLGGPIAHPDADDPLAELDAPKSTQPTAAHPDRLEIPKPRRVKPRAPLPPRQHPVQLVPFRDAPSYVRPYMTNACFYANQVSLIDHMNARARRGLVVNDTNIYVMTDDARVERTVPLLLLEGVAMQEIVAVKSLGMSKEWHTHVVLMLRDGPDLFLALSEDKRKDAATGALTGDRIPKLEEILVALLRSFDLDLPVLTLKEGESLRQLVKWNVTDVMMRREAIDVLAYRTSLMSQLRQVIRRDARLIVTRNQIESSGASQTVSSLLKEMDVVAAKNETTRSALRQTDATLQRSRAKEAEMREAIAAEARRRDATVRERLARRQGETVAAQAREFDRMRGTHQSDMRRLRVVEAFLRGRLADGAEAAAPALQRLRAAAAERKAAATAALAEAKRRLTCAKAAAQKAEAEVKTLRQVPEGEPVPDDVDRELAAGFLPVRLPEEAVGFDQSNADREKRNAAPNEDAMGSEREEDEELDLPPPTNSNSAKAPVVFDDDDL